MQSVKPSSSRPHDHGVSRHPASQELLHRHHAPLPAGELSDSILCTRVEFGCLRQLNSTLAAPAVAGHATRVAGTGASNKTPVWRKR
jgi:hypothetical protein